MGNLKDELKKLKPKIISLKRSDGGVQATAKQKSSHGQDEMSWKKDVKPLRNNANKVAMKPQKPRKGALKRKRKRIKDNLPSGESILAAYGHGKAAPARPTQAEKPSGFTPPGFGELPHVVLAEVAEFKEPDAWVDAGSALQAQAAGAGPVLRVRMGIDFGTAYTKVALQAADQVFFIDWDGVRKSNQHYFLPGEISRRDDDSTWLGRPKDASQTYGALKIPFLMDNGEEGSAASTAFLAWIMRYSRAWLYQHQPSLVQNRRLAWEVNMGSPTDAWCSIALTDRYKRIGSCAWKLSQNPGDISLDSVRSALSDTSLTPEAAGLDSLNIIPEFVAQIAGYLKSPQGKEEGLHLLVDVGAGTLDIAAFNVYRPKKDASSDVLLPIFAGSVEPLGTHVLMAARLQCVEAGIQEWDDLDGIPSREQLSSEFGIDGDSLKRLDGQFATLIQKCTGKIIHYTKTIRYPRAPQWKKGMRIFLTGGGASCKVYRSGVEGSFNSIGTPPLFTSFPMLDAAAKRVGEQNFHRISVAFGLTYDAESIAKIIQPKDIDDVRVNLPSRQMPDREELYPK